MKKVDSRFSADYERAKKRELARLKKGFNLGFVKPKSRDELHDRGKMRADSESGPGSGAEEKPAADWFLA